MVLLIRQTPEPLSDQSTRPGEEGTVLTAPSAASRILRQELRRYCDGHIQGRSFLISGHRGSGKTTTVSDVLTTVLKMSRNGDVALRPLPVLLHGPSLFRALPSDYRAEVAKNAQAQAPAPEPGQSATESSPGTPAAAAAGARPPGPTSTPAKQLDEDSRIEIQAQLALKQIILGLHRATAREYAAAYRRALVPEQGATGGDTTLSEHGELAAQFELELMEDPPASRLRELWEHIGALEAGVLFPNGRAADTAQARRAKESGVPPLLVADQGARELVALNGICNAHQRISGDLSGETTTKAENSISSEKARGFDARTAEAFKPVVSMLSGAAVAGGSIAAAGATFIPEALGLGLLTALTSGLILKRTSTSSGKRERQIDKKFIPDLSVRTLDRVLPTLLERLRSAGLAPVFVIDELDKVDGLSERIMSMVHYLKKLVAESVFTCFLTDRGYMEYLRLAARKKAYGVAYSYFSHSLLIAHEPADLDAYLERVLELPQGSEATATADATDKEILKWVLRHRSQMHALNLTRELAALRTDSGRCSLLPGAVRDNALYRIDATLQVAIEFFLNSADVVGWSMQRPNMRQTLYDALYFISREWLAGKKIIDLRESQKMDFRKALYGRMNLDEACRRDGNGFGAEVPMDAEEGLISDDDLTILYGTVGQIAALLAGAKTAARIRTEWPQNLQERSDAPKAPRPDQSVLEVLMLGKYSFLTPDDHLQHVYHFRYWQSGERKGKATAREPEEIHLAAKPYLAFVTELQNSVATLLRPDGSAATPPGGDLKLLTDDVHVLPQTPPWQQALAAHQALELARLGQGSAADLEANLILLTEFKEAMSDSVFAVGPALSAAAFLAGVRPTDQVVQSLPKALALLASGLRFETLDSKKVQHSLQAFQDHVGGLSKGGLFESEPVLSPDSGALISGTHAMLVAAYARGHEFAESHGWDQRAEVAWRQLLERLSAHEQGSRNPTAGFDEILCSAHMEGPGMVLPLALETATLNHWSIILTIGLRPWKGYPLVPFEVVPYALLRLGLGRVDSIWLDGFCESLRKLANASQEHGAALRSTLATSAAMKRDPPPTGSFIVIRKEHPSLTNRWTGVPARALFVVLTVKQFRAELDDPKNKSILTMLPAPVRVRWEPSADEGVDEAAIRTLVDAALDKPDFGVLEAQLSPALATPRGPDELASLTSR